MAALLDPSDPDVFLRRAQVSAAMGEVGGPMSQRMITCTYVCHKSGLCVKGVVLLALFHPKMV